jgi:hypothetical protein
MTNDAPAARSADIQALDEAYAAAARDARALLDGLDEAAGAWSVSPAAWSVAECLDHLAVANRVYLQAMTPSADRARARGRVRRGPATPGIVGRWFVGVLEPPVARTRRVKAPSKIRPRVRPALADASRAFFASVEDVRAALQAHADVDLAGVRFPNPFIPGVRFSLATGFHVMAAHMRRHLWQAWNVRRAAEAAGSDATAPHQPIAV